MRINHPTMAEGYSNGDYLVKYQPQRGGYGLIEIEGAPLSLLFPPLIKTLSASKHENQPAVLRLVSPGSRSGIGLILVGIVVNAAVGAVIKALMEGLKGENIDLEEVFEHFAENIIEQVGQIVLQSALETTLSDCNARISTVVSNLSICAETDDSHLYLTEIITPSAYCYNRLRILGVVGLPSAFAALVPRVAAILDWWGIKQLASLREMASKISLDSKKYIEESEVELLESVENTCSAVRVDYGETHNKPLELPDHNNHHYTIFAAHIFYDYKEKRIFSKKVQTESLHERDSWVKKMRKEAELHRQNFIEVEIGRLRGEIIVPAIAQLEGIIGKFKTEKLI